MQNHDSSSSGEPHDRSPKRFFQLFTKMEKYLYFDTKWELLDKSTPGDILLEVAMRADDSDEYQFAHTIFCGLPKRSRRVYAFHYGGGLSVSEIARMCNTTEDKIKRSLKRIRHLLGSKETHATMIRFVKIELQFAEERCRKMSIKLMLEHGVDPAAVYGATQAVDPAVMPTLMDITNHSLNQIAENLGIETPEVLKTATADDAANSGREGSGATCNEVFDEILEALKLVHDELLVKEIEELVRLMNQSAYTELFITHYQRFARISAIRCAPLTAFLARLAEFLPYFSSHHS